MTIDDIAKLTKVIPITPGSTNIIFVDRHAITKEDARELAMGLHAQEADYGAICLINGNPNDAVKLVSVENIKEIADASA